MVNLIRCKLRKLTCHYPKEGARVVKAQPIVIIIFVTTREEEEGGQRGRSKVTKYEDIIKYFLADFINKLFCHL